MNLYHTAKASAALLAALAFVLPDTTVASSPQTDQYGAINRLCEDTSRPVYMIFSADSLFEGGQTVVNTLREHNVKASFFFTGNFLRRQENEKIIKEIITDGHYVGGHSDRHILLCDWSQRRNTLVSGDSLIADTRDNYRELSRFGISYDSARIFLPPFEWHNSESVETLRDMGLTPIALTPGILTYRDYTTPDMPEYHTTDSIVKELWTHEKQQTLNGAIMIIHAGTQPSRTDKLYNRLPEIITKLKNKGYTLRRF